VVALFGQTAYKLYFLYSTVYMIVLLAVGAGFLSCFIDSLALSIWRLASTPIYNTFRVAILGYFFQVVAMLLDVVSLSLLTEFTHSIVDAFSLVTMLIASNVLLGEVPQRVDVGGALCVLGGICLTVYARPTAEDPDPSDPRVYGAVLESFATAPVLVWFASFVILVMLFFMCASTGYSRRTFAIGAGVVGALGETLAKAMTVAALTQNVLDVLVFLTIISFYILCELYIVRTSLKAVPLYVHQPTFFAAWALGGMCSGGFVYGDFSVYARHYDTIGMTIVGISLVLFGCLLPAALKSTIERKRITTSRVSAFLKRLAIPAADEYELELIAQARSI
jgi:hypothetical protein